MSYEDNKEEKPSVSKPAALSPRQQQVMDILYSQAPVTARRVWELIPNQPSYASVRTTLRSLVEAEHATYVKDKKTFVYSPAVATEQAAQSALGRLVTTFYQGSVASAVSGLLGMGNKKLDSEELEQLTRLIEDAKNETKKS